VVGEYKDLLLHCTKILSVTKQELKPGYVLTTFENGWVFPVPYKKDKDGNYYVEIVFNAVPYGLN
jgi:hypothetical protein